MHRKRSGHPGIRDSRDLDLVLRAAQNLDIPEYDVFTLAYRNWFGGTDPVAVDRAFAAYLLRKVVPAWVRHYARRTLTQGMSPHEIAVGLAPPGPAPTPRQGVIAGGLVLGAVALVIALAAAGSPPEGCFFPPCY
ncbi:MAG: hypothetical protein J4F47_06855 [Alphaproteobacteria bacterium]|nr:hypothetical protein [Alphaproteobacteria bacterium]